MSPTYREGYWAEDTGPMTEDPTRPHIPTIPTEPPILRYFEHGHLRSPLAEVSAEFGELARHLVNVLPPGPETSVALRKLLESKDAAVRAALG